MEFMKFDADKCSLCGICVEKCLRCAKWKKPQWTFVRGRAILHRTVGCECRGGRLCPPIPAAAENKKTARNKNLISEVIDNV